MITILICGLIMTIIALLFGNGARRIDQVFKIKKGKHYASGFFNRIPRFFIHKGEKEIEFYVTFHENCRYEIEGVDSFDINKVAGFSNGLHHQNSLRLGWNCINDSLNLYSYYYSDGKRKHYLLSLDKHEFGVPIHIKLIEKRHFYMIVVNGTEYPLTKLKYDRTHWIKCWRVSYYLKPYFGGNNPATHNMTIEIQEL